LRIVKAKRRVPVIAFLSLGVVLVLCCADRLSNPHKFLKRDLVQTFLLVHSEYVEPIDTRELFTIGCDSINEYFNMKRRRNEAAGGKSGEETARGKIEDKGESGEESSEDAVAYTELAYGGLKVELRGKPPLNLAPVNFREPRAAAEALWVIISRAIETEDNFSDAFYAIMNTFTMKLDPHSGFMSPKDYSEFVSDTHGRFSGVGIEIGMRADRITVIAPIEGTPAWRAGIKTGDVIVKIDGENAEGMSLLDAVKRIRGPEGTIVTLVVERPGTDAPLEFPIERATIHIFAVKSQFIRPHTAYFRLTTFHQNTTEELKEARELMWKRHKKEIRAVILDLRGNAGGLLDQAVGVADMFIRAGTLVSIRERNEDSKESFVAEEDDSYLERYPLIVLIGPGSASASEIVAGAIKDHDRGLLMGMKTFGKGSVQSIFNLKGGSALRLTTALYYTPSGRSIQAVGIVPHVEFTFLTDEGEAFEPFGEDKLAGHLKPKTKPQQPLLVFPGDILSELYKKKGLISDELDPKHPEREDFMVRLAVKIHDKPKVSPTDMLERTKSILEASKREARELNIELKPARKEASSPERKERQEQEK